MVGIDATNTFPAKTCRGEPLRNDIAAAPANNPAVPAQVWTTSMGEYIFLTIRATKRYCFIGCGQAQVGIARVWTDLTAATPDAAKTKRKAANKEALIEKGARKNWR